MRAFLSHSSKDKGFVETVATFLKPGTFELDSQTFDRGLINAAAIEGALRRSDLFCLFLSKASISSAYVDFETMLGVEFFARGDITKFLAICLDDESFSQASESVRFFNLIRKASSPESVARLIQGSLVAAASHSAIKRHPFIGREDQLLELERQVNDPARPPPKALFVSGNFGAGRRSLAKKFYQNQYPHVGGIFPTIELNEFSGFEELFRKVLAALRPSMNTAELKTRVAAFAIASSNEKSRQIAELIGSVLAAREAIYLLDVGGILADSGAFQPEIASVIDLLKDRPHPPVVVVAPRMVPLRLRRSPDDVAYVGLRALNRDESTRLAARLFKDNEIQTTLEQLTAVVELADGHPYNFYRIVEEIREKGLQAFLANPRDFLEWKHRQSSEYLSKVTFSAYDNVVLGLLTLVPLLDFDAIVQGSGIEAADASEVLLRLSNLHIVEHDGELFKISPPLRIAVERDKRAVLRNDLRPAALKALAQTLTVRLDEGSARIDLIDSAMLASIESGQLNTAFANVFLLPSHYVWLAKRNYDVERFDESIRLANEALKGRGRLSKSAIVTAYRFMCLAAARIGDDQTFRSGVTGLVPLANDEWAKSNVAFLRGFQERLKGNLPAAEEFFRQSYDLSPGNISAAREIAAICLSRGTLDEAEKFAREAHSHARSNPYLIDILVAVLIRKLGKNAKANSEVLEMLDALRKVGEEAGRSFYSTRRAELEHLWGDNRLARELIEQAIEKTPSIFEPRRLYAEILLKEGNNTRAGDVVNWMQEKVNSRDPSERRTNYRLFLETRAHYLTAVGQYEEAKEIFRDAAIFSPKETAAAIREIEIVQSYKTTH